MHSQSCVFPAVFSYCLVREAKKPSFVRLDQRSNEELKTRTKQLCEVIHIHVYVRLQCMVGGLVAGETCTLFQL